MTQMVDAVHYTNRPVILVAEDDESQLDLVTRFLTRYGYQAVGAVDGKEAVKRT